MKFKFLYYRDFNLTFLYDRFLFIIGARKLFLRNCSGTFSISTPRGPGALLIAHIFSSFSVECIYAINIPQFALLVPVLKTPRGGIYLTVYISNIPFWYIANFRSAYTLITLSHLLNFCINSSFTSHNCEQKTPETKSTRCVDEKVLVI